MYDKVAIITQIWHRAKSYLASMSNTWYLITVSNINRITTFFSETPQQTHTKYEKKRQILFYMNQRRMVPDYSTQYGENLSSYHGRMCEEGPTDRQTDRWIDS